MHADERGRDPYGVVAADDNGLCALDVAVICGCQGDVEIMYEGRVSEFDLI